MARYVKGTQNHLDVIPVAASAAGIVVPAAECPDCIAIYTRAYAAGATGAAAYTGIFRFVTALTSVLTGTRVDIDPTGDSGNGTAVAATVGGNGGTITKAIPASGVTVAEVAINVGTDSKHV